MTPQEANRLATMQAIAYDSSEAMRAIQEEIEQQRVRTALDSLDVWARLIIACEPALKNAQATRERIAFDILTKSGPKD